MSAARSGRIDALRGCAVFGIMLVNVWGFAYGYLLFTHPDSAGGLGWADRLVIWAISVFAEQKFYPIFAFLFGAGFALQTGRRQPSGAALDHARATYRRRLRWLLVCGVLHGTLLWFGDILTAYAVTGFWLVFKLGQPLSKLVRSLKLLIAVNLLILLVCAFFMAAAGSTDLEQGIAASVDAERVRAIYTQGGWLDVARQRLQDYGTNLIGFFVYVPRFALLFMLGVLAARLGYLTRPARHRAFWRRVLTVGLLIGLPLNLWWGEVAVDMAVEPYARQGYEHLVFVLVDVAGPLLASALVAVFMLGREGFARWLEPVGRMALSNYLAQSLVLMLLLQGFGLGLGARLSHAAMLALLVPIMAAQLVCSHWWMARHAQGPVEALWRRYTHGNNAV